ncbi:MAG: recombination protein NinG [Melioribacteraceae bacterium]|jgi:hypothetical protein|nr:recombination protein NinG [Melioribacteraceae bacterium]
MKKKTLPQLKKKAQILFNAAMRKKLPYCISCGNSTVILQAGHYYPTSTHDGLRYEEDNCWPECVWDNCFNEGHLINYGENLRELLGPMRFAELVKKATDYKMNGHKWSREELENIIQKYST